MSSWASGSVPCHYRLTHPALDFWVDVAVHERDGRFIDAATG